MSTARSLLKEARRLRRPPAGAAAIPADPISFANEVGFVPDDWQRDVLGEDHERKILLCGRQTGKTSVGGLLAIHKALTVPGSTTLIVAPSERQAKLAFNAAAGFYRKAGAPVSLRSDRRTGMELRNGSVIEALPALERTIRGFSVDLLILDEAAAVPDEDYFALLPSLIATRGEQLLLSTPRGKRGFFYDLWSAGDEEWFQKSVRTDEVDRISPEDLETLRRTGGMPDWWYEQEFECQFLDQIGSLFSVDDIERALEAGEEVEAIRMEDEGW